MTFLETIKNEIVEALPKHPCCRRNMLFGLLVARGEVAEGGKILLRIPHRESATLALHLVKEQLGRTAQNIPSERGGRYFLISFESRTARAFLEDLSTRFLAHPMQKGCDGCASAFLKGLFLASGHISDPAKAYHLEFSLGERAEAMLPFIEREYGLSPRLSVRRNEKLLYFKDSSAIEDVMAVLGINEAAFLFMNKKIEKQFRNEANRRTNCEAGNITRSVNAAAKILTALRWLEAEGKLSSLSDELVEVARLRLSYPEASLSQLATITTPALTKSGVNHRLQKIMEFAEKQGFVASK